MGKLVRSNSKMVAGVCAGVAEKLGWGAGLVRLLWIVLAIVLLGSPVVFYLILWVILPSEKHTKKSYSERMNERLGKS